MFSVTLLLYFFFDRGANFPRSAPFLAGGLLLGLILVSRLLAMMVQNGDFRALFRARSTYGQDAILVGPAPHLYSYLNDRVRKKEGRLGFNPVGLIETSGQYQGRSIRSVPILGDIDDLRETYKTIAGKTDLCKLYPLIPLPTAHKRQTSLKLPQILVRLWGVGQPIPARV